MSRYLDTDISVDLFISKLNLDVPIHISSFKFRTKKGARTLMITPKHLVQCI